MSQTGKSADVPIKASLPLVSLVRKVGSAEDELPNTRLLQCAPSNMDRRPRLFMVVKAAALQGEEIITVIRLGRHQMKIGSYQHENLLRHGEFEIEQAGYSILAHGGGGFIEDDIAKRKIDVICKSAIGPADPEEVVAILRKGLPKEYEGYAINTKVIRTV